jgi:hypothetical protein
MYGKNIRLVRGFTTCPDDVEPTGSALAALPGTVATEVDGIGLMGVSRNQNVRVAGMARRKQSI